MWVSIAMVAAGLSAIITVRDRNLIILVLAVELLFFAVSIFYVTISTVIVEPRVAALALSSAIITVAMAAAEAAVFLAIISAIYKSTRSIRLRRFKLRK